MATGGGYRNRDRSRSPVSINSVGHRRDKKGKDNNMSNNMGMGNMPMMMNNMYQQANMMMSNAMAGGMPNAMAGGMPNAMAGGMPNAMTGGMTNAMTGGMPNAMTGGMYPNMMMQGSMMGPSMMPTSGVDMIANPGMDILTQQPMEMSNMGSNSSTPNVDMNMMGGMGGIMMDPSMMGSMGMGNMQMFPNMTGDMPSVPREEVILKNCKLTPGNTDPPQRSRPLGCRTIFVGGWPEKIRESIIREIFERYGRIHTLRHSKKNFCHIRFERETSVDAAMHISGYKLKLLDKENKEEEEDSPANSGWLHVDYALSRDDQNDYERRQRQALRLQQQQMEALSAQQQMMGAGGDTAMGMGLEGQMRQRSPSPKIQPFSNNNILQLMERIKNEELFAVTLPTLLAWLERGECSKKNSNQFYSMIQATNSHIRRLYNEKMQSEEELQETRERVKQNIAKVIDQLEQVAKVFVAATHQRVWDHFTKPQRKNIESWQRMTQEFNILREEFNEKFNNEDKEDYGNAQNANNFNNYNMTDSSDNNPEIQSLKLENDSLRFQLEAYKNEVDVIKTDAKSELEKFKAHFIAHQALQGAFNKNPPLPSPVGKPPPPPPLPDDMELKEDTNEMLKENVDAGCGEAKLIGIMSAFLQVHPQGASLDYVVSYVRGVTSAAPAAVLRVLHKHPDVFQRSTTGVGANIEHRWNFVAFTSTDQANNGTMDEK